MLETNKIYCGDALELLKQLDDESVDLVITSPPYWALRDYGVEGQLGLEPTFDEYISKLCNIFDEVKRVLKKTGTCWVVIGDTYNSSGTNMSRNWDGRTKNFEKGKPMIISKELPSKCLLQIPARFSIEMINRGWILRNTIIWHKPNCIPASVKDRFTVDFEYIFFFVKNKKYYFEQQFERYIEKMNRWGGEKLKAKGKSTWDDGTGQVTYRDRNMRPNPKGRNKRTTWRINPKPFSEAHFAVYPEELIKTPIKAGCPEQGIVLDPFMGSGTTALVALKLNRNFIGFELNPEYVKIANKRIKDWLYQTRLFK